MVSVVVSIQMRKMFAEVRKMFSNGDTLSRMLVNCGLVRTSEGNSCSYEPISVTSVVQLYPGPWIQKQTPRRLDCCGVFLWHRSPECGAASGVRTVSQNQLGLSLSLTLWGRMEPQEKSEWEWPGTGKPTWNMAIKGLNDEELHTLAGGHAHLPGRRTHGI